MFSKRTSEILFYFQHFSILKIENSSLASRINWHTALIQSSSGHRKFYQEAGGSFWYDIIISEWIIMIWIYHNDILLIQILRLSVSENFHSSSRQLSVYESASFQIEKQFDIIMSFIESYLRRSWYHYDIVRLGRLILKNPWKNVGPGAYTPEYMRPVP